jgi:succinate dehydrogenase/fumarate reductase iron-sulfur protein
MQNITIKRACCENSQDVEYQIPDDKKLLLDAFLYIKHQVDNTLNFRAGCRSGVCGSCAVRVDGLERLACKTTISDGIHIEALNNSKIIKDLVIDLSYEHKKIKESQSFISKLSNNTPSKTDIHKIETQSDCILCQSCYSSCPVFAVNENFLGPYGFSRVVKYIDDTKESDQKSKIDNIQQYGLWDCTLCGNCTMVCPQGIDPKTDILNLRTKSSLQGYSDPNMQNFGGFDSGFNTDFGFNPNF